MGAELFVYRLGTRLAGSGQRNHARLVRKHCETHYVIGSAVGPSHFPYIVREAQSCIEEARGQFSTPGKYGQKVLQKLSGLCWRGSNCIGAFDAFVQTLVWS